MSMIYMHPGHAKLIYRYVQRVYFSDPGQVSEKSLSRKLRYDFRCVLMML